MSKTTETNTTESATEIRKTEQKQQLIEQLKKVPVIQIACEKLGISRMTYYRWHKEDEDFAKEADMAITDGSGLVNDLAESQLMTAIKNGNMTAIIFWLKHHHKAYATKVEVTARFQQPLEALTPEQQSLVEQALQLAGLTAESENSSEPLTINAPPSEADQSDE